MKRSKHKEEKAVRRQRRIRARLRGTATRPRLSVFRSNRYIYAQLIDDERGVTLGAASDRKLTGNKTVKRERAAAVGEMIAQAAQVKKINRVCFDRGRYRYRGRIAILADAARQAGLKF